MIIKRPFWQKLIEDAWKKKSIVWLMGPRRVGKTSLCRSLPNVEYFDCERPRVRQLLADPEGFLEEHRGTRIVLDEIHRLENPSELLKLAADHYPDIKIVATGSSTLGASAKFKDTLAGRKKEIWLTPLFLDELALFAGTSIRHRMLYGGFPSFFVAKTFPEDDFKEWLDAYWAKDIQDMFSVGKRYSFIKFAELLLAYSGGLFEASKFSAPCEVSRQTIANYLQILEETFVVEVVRPFSTHRPTEIVKSPKIYGLDTGFVCHAKGWQELRDEDLGHLWEHIVLNELQGHLQQRDVHYWRDKQGHEIDFVLPSRSSKIVPIVECKFKVGGLGKSPAALQAIAKNIQTFRKLYPGGENFVVASDVDRSFTREVDGIVLTFISIGDLVKKLAT